MNLSLNFLSETSFLSLFLKGGWVMFPLTLLSIWAVYLIIDRIFALRESQIYIKSEQLESINRKLIAGEYDMVYNMCNMKQLPITNIIRAGLDRFVSPGQTFESGIELAAREEIQKLEKNIGLLANIASIATLLGFFGTVIGMIEAFMAISKVSGAISPSVISRGIYEAMVTTAAGLFIGILATMGYNFASSRLNRFSFILEKSSNDLVELFKNLQQVYNMNSQK